jgi:DNA-binding transcriptional ArsR family regulator
MFELPVAVDLLSALAHEARLKAFRLLVRAGNQGLSAGELAGHLGLRPTAASFHLGRLRQAGLVHRRRAGQQIFYSADFDSIRALRAFLDRECCADAPDGCGPECGAAARADTLVETST